MAITLNTGTSFSAIQQAQRGSETSAQRLASGLRINSSRDDAAGAAISNRLSAQVIGFQQAVRNANDGISLLQTADGSLGSITENLQRFRELALQASSGTLNDSDRSAINAEGQQLRDEINRIVETASFNDVPLFTNDGSLDLQVGSNGGETVSLNTQNIQQQLQDSGFNDIDLSSASGALRALGVLDSTRERVDNSASQMGALNNRLDSTISQLQNSSVNAETSRSRIEDADFAREVSEKARNDVLLKAAIALQVQANMRGEMVLRLLNS